MRGSRTLCQMGSIFEFIIFFSIDEGREDQNTTISGPSSARQRNAVSLQRDDDGSTMNAGLVALCFFQGILTSIAKKPYIFGFFGGGGWSRPPAPSSGSVHDTSGKCI